VSEQKAAGDAPGRHGLIDEGIAGVRGRRNSEVVAHVIRVQPINENLSRSGGEHQANVWKTPLDVMADFRLPIPADTLLASRPVLPTDLKARTTAT
jgi:hypothetical protein